jgi:hypothetical protein
VVSGQLCALAALSSQKDPSVRIEQDVGWVSTALTGIHTLDHTVCVLVTTEYAIHAFLQ